MDYKKVIFPAFIILVLLQLFVPASMIFQQEDIVKNGKSFKFKTAPIDPYDPFRGKYVRLSFTDNAIEVADSKEWESRENIYASITEDKEGFAIVQSVSREKPAADSDFLYTRISHFRGDEMIVYYPFSRFYMEESKAYEAETLYREARRDTSQIAYALVKLKDGNAVLENVMINEVPLKEAVENSRTTAD